MLSRHIWWPTAFLVASLPAGAANLIPNPGFDEADPSGWTLNTSASLVFKPFAASRAGFETFLDNVFFVEDETCATTHNAICLNDDRFLVTVEWAAAQGASRDLPARWAAVRSSHHVHGRWET
jgi:hypothetical protein